MMKVLLPKVIHSSANAIQLFFETVTKLNIKKEKDETTYQIYLNKFNHFKQNVRTFEGSWEIFNRNLIPRSLNGPQMLFVFQTIILINQKLKKQSEERFNFEEAKIAIASIMI